MYLFMNFVFNNQDIVFDTIYIVIGCYFKIFKRNVALNNVQPEISQSQYYNSVLDSLVLIFLINFVSLSYPI